MPPTHQGSGLQIKIPHLLYLNETGNGAWNRFLH